MRKLFFILTLLLLHVCSVKAQTVTLNFDHIKEIQEWTVPNGVWEIELTAIGAGGGNAGTGTARAGGKGALVYGMYGVQPGDKFYFLIGEKGGDVSAPLSDANRGGGGGGGGTFVLKADPNGWEMMPDGTMATLIMVAGGGGGGFNGASNPHDATDNTSGQSTSNSIGDLYAGNFGTGGEGWHAGGGGGFYGDGVSLTSVGMTAETNGKSFYSGGFGGSLAETRKGGFGGGGAGYPGAEGGGGGGGGYSGGAAGVRQRGGGGGSYIDEGQILPESEFWIDAGYNRFDGTVQIIYNIAVLPLKLQSFTAHLRQPNVLLKWTTTLERNSSHFEIERSTDGKDFTVIGQVVAAGSSNSNKTYSYLDPRPSKVNHYRLKMMDIDGKTTYSKIVVIRSASSDVNLQVFPNPATTGIQLQTSLKGSLRITIYNAAGSLVKELVTIGDGAFTALPINVYNLNSGVYYIKVQSEEGIQTASFVKK